MESDLTAREHVAGAIRARANKQGLSQAALADLAGVNHSYMERVLTAKSSPSIDWLEKVAAALGCRIRDLVP